MLALGFILTAAFAARGRVASPTAVLFLVCGLALVFLVLLPVLVVMLGEDVRNIERVLRDPRVRAAVATTMKTASISTAVLLVGGVPLAYAVSRLRFTGKALVLSLIDIPIVIPQSVAGIALVRVFGRQQFIGEALFAWFGLRFEGTLLGICLAQVFVAMPFLVKTAIAAFDSVPEDLEISARTLGASSWEAFRRVALPLAARGIFLGAVLAWARAAGEFGALLFIAPTPETAPVAAYNRFNSVGLVESAPLVAALLIFTLVMFFLLQFVSRWLPGARGAGEVSFGAAA
jgi:molybdate/tungstate transport system permease protein